MAEKRHRFDFSGKEVDGSEIEHKTMRISPFLPPLPDRFKNEYIVDLHDIAAKCLPLVMTPDLVAVDGITHKTFYNIKKPGGLIRVDGEICEHQYGLLQILQRVSAQYNLFSFSPKIPIDRMKSYLINPNYDCSELNSFLGIFSERYQFAYSDYLLPSVCMDNGVAYIISDSVRRNENSHSERDEGCGLLNTMPVREGRKQSILLAENCVFAGVTGDGQHFVGFLIVIPHEGNDAFVLVLDPQGVREGQHDKKYLCNCMKHLCSKIVDVKVRSNKFKGDPPNVYLVDVGHPEHMTQMYDVSCSLWSCILLVQWVIFYGSRCSKNPVTLCTVLKEMFRSGNNQYDFSLVSKRSVVCICQDTKECKIGLNISMVYIRQYMCLLSQYMLQFEDLHEAVQALEDITHDEAYAKLPSLEFSKIQNYLDEYCRIQNKKFYLEHKTSTSSYVMAGDTRATDHFTKLCNCFRHCSTTEKSDFLDGLHSIDVFRLFLSSFDPHMCEPGKPSDFMQRLLVFDADRDTNITVYLPPTSFAKSRYERKSEFDLLSKEKYELGQSQPQTVVELDD